MSFLAPLFLAGIVLVAGPILFHLIRQVSRNRVIFSSTELLDNSEPKTEKSRRIQNPWLLLIRCLIIALLAFAFARPFVPDSEVGDPKNAVRRDVVIAIDGSASMDRPGSSQQVLEEAKTVIETLTENDQLSVFVFMDTIAPLVSVEQWTDLPPDKRQDFALAQIENWVPTQYPGLLDLGITEAVTEIEKLRERSTAKSYGEIVVISDFAEGTSVSGIELIEWPNSVRFTRKQITTPLNTQNLGLRWLGWNDGPDESLSARIAITNTVPSTIAEARVFVSDATTGQQVGDPIEIVLDGTSEQVMNVSLESDTRNRPLVFRLEGDALTFDNTLHVSPTYVPLISAGLFSQYEKSDPKNAPYFIAKGFAGFESPLLTLDAGAPASSSNESYVIERALSSEEAEFVSSQIVDGKAALLIANGIYLEDTIRTLTGDSTWRMEKRSPGHLLIGEVDFDHSLFSPFADPRFSNFANIRIWQAPLINVPVSENYRMIARFDDGSPLLTEIRIGKGRIFLWTGSWAPSDSQWVLSSKFIPFLHRFALLASGGPSLPSNVTLTHASSDTYSDLFPSQSIDATSILKVEEQAKRWVAFQLDSQESRTNTISSERWDQLALPEFNEATQQAQIEAIAATTLQESATRIEKRQQIWQWLLWLVLALLAVESFAAIKMSKRQEVTS